MNGTKLLKDLASRVAALDDRIIEVFIHSDSPKDPFKGDEIFLVCHVGDPEINRDNAAMEDRGHQWGLDMSDAVQPMSREMGIEQEIVVMPFNFELYADGEYGKYYGTLFLKEGYEPILEWSDREWANMEQDLLGEENLKE